MPTKRSKWPLYLIGASAAVAVWSGWVGLGALTGFGPVHLLPGIWNNFTVNTAITLPTGVEAYGAYALGTWIDHETPETARKFAKWSSIGSLLLGMLGQISYHLLVADHKVTAPWWITMLVSCLPVVTLGLAAGLHHMKHVPQPEEPKPAPAPVAGPSIETLQRIQASLPTVASPRPQMPTPEPAPAQSLAELVQRAGPQPTFTPSTPEPAGTVTVRGPMSRLDKKVPADERATGTFRAISETTTIPAATE